MQARIAHATYDMMTSPLVTAALWKRLNDTGKNWRHVYKSLILLEYLLKAGADHIVLEVRANMFALQTLTDFQYVGKSGVDKGINVREHARAVIALLSDEPRLQAARDEGSCAARRVGRSNQGTFGMSNRCRCRCTVV